MGAPVRPNMLNMPKSASVSLHVVGSILAQIFHFYRLYTLSVSEKYFISYIQLCVYPLE